MARSARVWATSGRHRPGDVGRDVARAPDAETGFSTDPAVGAEADSTSGPGAGPASGPGVTGRQATAAEPRPLPLVVSGGGSVAPALAG